MADRPSYLQKAQHWLNIHIAAGEVSNYEVVAMFGENLAVGTSEETIWPEGGLYVFPTAATTMTISSASANDTSAGTGARTVLVKGLDASYEEIQEVVTLNGTTGVTLANQYFRINQAFVATAGSGKKNAGIMYIGEGSITAGKPATVYCHMPAGYSRHDQAVYTVPARKTFIPGVFELSDESSKTLDFKIRRTLNGVESVNLNLDVVGESEINPQYIIAIPATSDLVVDAEIASGSSDAKVAIFALLRTVS